MLPPKFFLEAIIGHANCSSGIVHQADILQRFFACWLLNTSQSFKKVEVWKGLIFYTFLIVIKLRLNNWVKNKNGFYYNYKLFFHDVNGEKLLSALKSKNVEFGNQWMGLCHTEHLTLDIVDIYFLSALLHGVLD